MNTSDMKSLMIVLLTGVYVLDHKTTPDVVIISNVSSMLQAQIGTKRRVTKGLDSAVTGNFQKLQSLCFCRLFATVKYVEIRIVGQLQNLLAIPAQQRSNVQATQFITWGLLSARQAPHQV